MPGSVARAVLAVVLLDTAMNATNIIIYIKKIGARSIYRNGGGIEVPKSMIKRIITAGPLVMEAVYPASSVRDGTRVRQGKSALSSRAKQRMNFIYAWQKLKLLIAANFGPKDIFVTLTYSDERLPPGRREVMRDVSAFTKSLRRERKGEQLRYIYVIEHKHDAGRWHVHILINASGDDYDRIRRLWGRGNVEFRKIRVDREKHYETLARYLCKEQRDRPGLRLWSGSRNLKKPERDSFRVDADTTLRAPPKGKALLLAEETVVNPYGKFRYIEYVMLAGLPRPKRSRRRR